MKESKILSVFYITLSFVIIFYAQEMFLTVVLNHFGQKGIGYNVNVDTTNYTIKYQYFNKYLGKEITVIRAPSTHSLVDKFSNKKNITIYYSEYYPYRPRVDRLNDFSVFISSFIGLLVSVLVFIISLKEILNPFFVKKRKE